MVEDKETGEVSEKNIYGDIILGSPAADLGYPETFTTGEHDLTIIGANVTAYGLVEAENLDIQADGTFTFTGSTMTAKKDMTINASGNVDINNAVEDGNEITADTMTINGENVTIVGGLTANNGFSVTAADTATINAATLVNGIITAGNEIVLDQKDAALAVTDATVSEGIEVDVDVNAPKVTVDNGTNVTLRDLFDGEDATIINVNANDTVTLSSVSDMTGEITADTLVIDGAVNAAFDTTVSNLAVFDVVGQADVTNTGSLNILDSALTGDLVVSADENIIVADATIQAKDVDLYADLNLNLENAAVIAANNFTAGGSAIVVDGENTITAGNLADFTAAVEGEGNIDILAKTAVFEDTVEIGSLDIVADSTVFNSTVDAAGKITVSGDQLVFAADVTAGDEIDFRGVNQTLIVNDLTLASKKIYNGDISAVDENEGFLYAVVIDGEAFASARRSPTATSRPRMSPSRATAISGATSRFSPPKATPPSAPRTASPSSTAPTTLRSAPPTTSP